MPFGFHAVLVLIEFRGFQSSVGIRHFLGGFDRAQDDRFGLGKDLFPPVALGRIVLSDLLPSIDAVDQSGSRKGSELNDH